MNRNSMGRFFNRLLLTTSMAVALPLVPAHAVPVLFGGDGITINGEPGGSAELAPGAVIAVTGPLLQLQLADGSTITLPEGSSFRIVEDGGSVAFELVSGSIRVDSKGTPISVSRDGVTISSSAGAYSAFASAGGGLDGRVNAGAVTVASGGETRAFNAGEGYVASSDGISGTFTPPATEAPRYARGDGAGGFDYSPADTRGDGESAPPVLLATLEEIGAIGGGGDDGRGGDNGGGDDGGDNGGGDNGDGHVDLTPGVSSGSVSAELGSGPYAVAYASNDIGLDVRSGASAEFTDGELDKYEWLTEEKPERGTNLTAELAGDELVTVGRWNGGTTAGQYYAAPAFKYGGQQGFHYAIGIGTVTPITSGTATYSLEAATKPTFGDGNGAPGTLTGDIAVSFGLVTRIGLDLAVDMPDDHIYILRTTGGTTNVASSEVQLAKANWDDLGPVFYGQFAMADGGRACQQAGQCAASVRGFLAGDNAEGIGLSYQIGDTGGPADHAIYGAAYFKGDGVTGGGDNSSGVSSGAITAPLGAGPYTVTLDGGFAVAGTVGLDANGALETVDTVYSGGDTGSRGTNAVADLWGNEDVTIGRFNGGKMTGYLVYGTYQQSGDLFPNLQSIHYAIGAPLTNIPVYGKATYTLAAYTAPTFFDGGSAPGTFSGSMAVGFGGASPKVGFDIAIDMPGDRTYSYVTEGGLDNLSLSPFTVVTAASASNVVGQITRSNTSTLEAGGRACPATSSTCFISIGGMLAGEGGSSAAITYKVWQSGANDTYIVGGAAFTTTGVSPTSVTPGALSSPYSNGNYNGMYIGPTGSGTGFSNVALGFEASGALVKYANANIGTAGMADLGQNADAMWGRWTGGTSGGTGTNSGANVEGNRSLHYMVTSVAPTASVPANGTATYELAGATSPTFKDGRSAPGTLTGSLAVGWNGYSSKLGLDLTVSMPGDADYNIKTSGGTTDVASSTISMNNIAQFIGTAPVTATAGASICASGCSASIDAQGYGVNAPLMGVTYGFGSGAAAINGIGVFTKQN